MFKVLFLQRYYGLGDHRIQYQIVDRTSFRQFLGIESVKNVPDEKTVWKYKEALQNGHNYAVWRTDSLGEITDSYLPYEKGYYEMIGKEIYFTVSGDNIIFHSFMKDGYYTFDSKGILKYTNMNFNRPIPRNTPIAYDDVAKGKYQYLSTTPYVTDDYVLTEIGQGNLSEIQLYNNKEKTFLQNSDESCVNAMADVSGIWGQQFVSFIPDVETYKDFVSCGFKKADKTTECCLNKGGQCLVIYSMK